MQPPHQSLGRKVGGNLGDGIDEGRLVGTAKGSGGEEAGGAEQANTATIEFKESARNSMARATQRSADIGAQTNNYHVAP